MSAPSLENVKTSPLVLFSCSLASLFQLATLSTSLCRVVVISVLDAPRQAIARSSAYALTKVASSNCPRRSLMKMMKMSGDRADPCGRPSLKFRFLPRVPWTFTLASRLGSVARPNATNRGGGRVFPASASFVGGRSSTPYHAPSSSRRGKPPYSPSPGTVEGFHHLPSFGGVIQFCHLFKVASPEFALVFVC